MPGWILYVLSRVINFSFTMSGWVAIALPGGCRGLRELRELECRLLRWRFGVRCYCHRTASIAWRATDVCHADLVIRGTTRRAGCTAAWVS